MAVRIKGLDRPPAAARPAIPAAQLATMAPLDRGAELLAAAFSGCVIELALQAEDSAMSVAALEAAPAPAPAASPAPAPAPAPPAPPSAWEERRDRCLAGEPVLANCRKGSGDQGLIDWAREDGRLVMIDRTGPWGNDFQMKGKSQAERDRVCDAHAGWLDGQTDLLGRIPELGGKVLVCWCAPKRCHGDELIRRWKEQQQCSAAPAAPPPAAQPAPSPPPAPPPPAPAPTIEDAILVAQAFLERIHVRRTTEAAELVPFVRHALGAAGFGIEAFPPALVAMRLTATT